MKINKIEPQGYCGGVIRALKIMDKALEDESLPRPIYCLGSVIHNSHVINNYSNRGIITIEDKGLSRLELLDKIDSGTVIFSAHGVSPEAYEKAKNKGLTIVDATCPMVLSVHDKIKKYLENGYECIYIGTTNHPECEGVLGISNRIHFISKESDVSNLDIKSDKIYVTNQTTLSMYDIKIIFDCLKQKYPNIEIDDKICDATTKRQTAMYNQPDCDLCIIVGDPKSSNTKKLYKVSKEIAGKNTIFIEDLSMLDNKILDGVKTVNISSGASTPPYLVDEIINYLSKLQ